MRLDCTYVTQNYVTVVWICPISGLEVHLMARFCVTIVLLLQFLLLCSVTDE